MAGVTFAHEVILDGNPWKCRRVGQGARGIVIDYVPLQSGDQGTVQLTPATNTTWHRGSGASLPLSPPIVGMNAWSKNGWTCDPGLVLPGPLVTTVNLPGADGDTAAFCEQDGDLYVFSGRYANRIPNGSGAPVFDQDLGAGFVAANGGARRFNGNMQVAGGVTVPTWEKVASGGAWNQSADTYRGTLGSVFWTVSGVTAERLVGQFGSTGLRYVAFGASTLTDANWVPATPIDVGPYPITSLVATRDHIYIGTTGGLRDLDSSGLAPNLMPQVEAAVFATNGRATLADGGFIYYGAGYGLLRVNVANATSYGVPDDVSPPGQALPNETPVTGLPMAITRYGQWIILAQWDAATGPGGTTYISWGRQSLGGYGQYASKSYASREVGPMVWNSCPIVLDGLQVTRMHVSGLVAGNPRLWMGVTDSAGTRSLRWAPLPLDTPYQDLRNGRPYRFATSFDLYETYEDWGDDTITKIVPDIVAESESLGVGSTFTVWAAVDGSATYDQIGVLNSSPRAVMTPTNELKANRVQLKISGTGTSASPPILRKRALRAFGRPDLREVRTYQFLIGSGVRHPGGNPAGVNTVQQKNTLAALQKGSSVTMRDEDGQALRVLVASGIHFTEVEVDMAQGRGERMLAATVALAVLSTPGTTFKWGDGTRFGDAGKVWS